MAINVPKPVLDMLNEVGMTQKQAMWNCHGTWVMYHKSLEKLAAYKKLKFEKPELIHQDLTKKEVVLLVTGHRDGVSEWSYGEATPSNNKNAYPFAMAEKRAKDRVILKLLGFHGDVYSDAEIDSQVQQELANRAKREKEGIDPTGGKFDMWGKIKDFALKLPGIQNIISLGKGIGAVFRGDSARDPRL